MSQCKCYRKRPNWQSKRDSHSGGFDQKEDRD